MAMHLNSDNFNQVISKGKVKPDTLVAGSEASLRTN